jgi:hypothetical protein
MAQVSVESLWQCDLCEKKGVSTCAGHPDQWIEARVEWGHGYEMMRFLCCEECRPRGSWYVSKNRKFLNALKRWVRGE